MESNKVFQMKFSEIYPLLVSKAEKKGRTKEEVNSVIFWLTGYDEAGLKSQLDKESTYENFFNEAPAINPNSNLITGTVCGKRLLRKLYMFLT